jgi:streptogramin lyase
MTRPSSSAGLLRVNSRMPAVASTVLLALCLALLSTPAHCVKSVTKASYFPLAQPAGVAVDALGDVYGLVGTIGTIVKWSAAGKLLSTTTPLPVGYLQGLALDGCGNQYLGGEQTVYRVSAATGQLSQFQTPPADGSLESVPSIAADTGSGLVYACDEDNGRVVVFDHNGLVLSFVDIAVPIAVSADSAGNVYVIEHLSNIVSKMDPSGAGQTFSTSHPSMSYSSGLAVGSLGNVFVADPGNRRVVQFSKTGEFRDWQLNTSTSSTSSNTTSQSSPSFPLPATSSRSRARLERAPAFLRAGLPGGGSLVRHGAAELHLLLRRVQRQIDSSQLRGRSRQPGKQSGAGLVP